jgi:allantoinase
MEPRMMSIGMHMRLIGNPSRAVAVERLLDHLSEHRDLWIARRIDIAKHWHTLHGGP